MILRNLIFKLEVIKERLPAGLVSHHEQASKADREQQHRVLCPAYNPSPATRQASTERLFQQTRLFSSVDVPFWKSPEYYRAHEKKLNGAIARAIRHCGRCPI